MNSVLFGKPTATKIKDITDMRGKAALFKLSKPLENLYDVDEDGTKSYEYVVVSAAVVPSFFAPSEPETFIFGADPTGEILSFSELKGSERGIYDHNKALENAGYEVIE